jgi:hypothetical protein
MSAGVLLLIGAGIGFGVALGVALMLALLFLAGRAYLRHAEYQMAVRVSGMVRDQVTTKLAETHTTDERRKAEDVLWDLARKRQEDRDLEAHARRVLLDDDREDKWKSQGKG